MRKGLSAIDAVEIIIKDSRQRYQRQRFMIIRSMQKIKRKDFKDESAGGSTLFYQIVVICTWIYTQV
jgi:hypothetical protein